MQINQRIALISVSDKTNIAEFAKGLSELGFLILSTGGTADLIRKAGVAVTDAGSYTQAGELMDGRVKTLHPRIHAGILWDRSNPKHGEQARAADVNPIDLVAVNLYPFYDQAISKKLPYEQAIEYIDIGGPSMLRAAAKNSQHVIPVCDPADYQDILTSLKSGEFSLSKRQQLAVKAFRYTAAYDQVIHTYLDHLTNTSAQSAPPLEKQQDMSLAPALPEQMSMALQKIRTLRYGENPHQSAALYQDLFATSNQVGNQHNLEIAYEGKELSYNNFLDMDAAWKMVHALLPKMACAIIKHNNPCGVAVSKTTGINYDLHGKSDNDIASIYERALAGDPTSAFGGIVAFNAALDAATAEKLAAHFYECIVATDFSEDALALLKTKKNLRLIKMSPVASPEVPLRANLTFKQTIAGVLVQQSDEFSSNTSEWKTVTRVKPTDHQRDDLAFAFTVVKYVKSNAIVLVKNGAILGIGAGQMSRIDSTRIAIEKALSFGKDLQGAILASDAFFPFADNIELAAKHGITAIIQPGGSIRDAECIAAADKLDLAMIFTQRRHFLH